MERAPVRTPAIIPEVVRKAFKVAEGEKPGATHIELPEDVMATEIDGAAAAAAARPCCRSRAARELLRAADLIRGALNPVALAGNGVIRAKAPRRRCASSCAPPASRWRRRSWARACSPPTTRQALGSVGLQAGDYEMAGFDEADVVLAIGYDLVEHSPEHWNPKPRQEDHLHRLRARRRSTRTSCPRSSWSATSTTCSPGSARSAGTCPTRAARSGCATSCCGRFEQAKDDDAFPVQPPRALYEIRQALGRDDILISDVGLHKLWIGRMFPAYEPNTVLIANGLAGMGFAVPAAVAAKLVHPERKVVTVNGDGGFLMNCQELETAVRLRTAVRERDLGEPASTARSSGSRTRSSAATSASTSRTRTS